MVDEDERYPVQAPGWAAIDRAAAELYPGQSPHQLTSQRAYDLDSSSPLPAVSVFEAAAPGRPHWHAIGYGLSELFEKSSPDPEHSGFGFELTMRVPRDPDETRPPAWVIQLIQALGHYVLSQHAPIDTGHVIDLGGPLGPPLAASGDEPTRPSALEGVVCVPDPQLGRIETPHGAVLFLQLYGLTRDELEPMRDWTLERKVGLVSEVDPLAITDPARRSMLEDRRTAPVYRRFALGIMI